MNPIIPRVSGYISKVYVKDNDFVKKGDTLFTIDKRDYQLKIDEANAALLGAEGQYEAAKANKDMRYIYDAVVNKLKSDDKLGFSYVYDRFLSQDLVFDKYLTPKAVK